jgi:hypothetical protein
VRNDLFRADAAVKAMAKTVVGRSEFPL